MNVLITHDGPEASASIGQDLLKAGLPPVVNATVLYVAESGPLGDTSGLMLPSDMGEMPRVSTAVEDRALAEAKATAERAATEISAIFPSWSVRTDARLGKPSRVILQAAQDRRADLIVVRSTGKTKLQRWVLGSVSREVMEGAHCAMRLARPERLGRDTLGGPLRIMIGYDGSPDADRAARAVGERFWPARTRVRLVTAVDGQVSHATESSASGPGLAQERFTRLQHFVDDAADSLRDVGLDVSNRLEEDDAKHLLLQEAGLWLADCLFLGSRGLGPVARLFMGSVSTVPAETAPCSVELIRPGVAESEKR